MKVMCQVCSGLIEIPDARPANIHNFAVCSVITMEHADEITCPHCQTLLVLAVVQVNMALIATPLPKAAQRNLIVSPNGVRM